MAIKISKRAIFAIALVTCIVLALNYGCGRSPSFKGKWYSTDASSMLDFIDNERVTVVFRLNIPEKTELPEKVGGFKIDLGFHLAEYSGKATKSLLIQKPGNLSQKEKMQFSLREEKVVPWTKILFSTDSDGNIRLKRHQEGQEISGVKVENSDSVVLYAIVKNKQVLIDQMSFSFEYMDLDLNWIGKLTTNALYRITSRSKCEIYVPIKIDDSVADIIICEGILNKGQIRMHFKSFEIQQLSYKKVSSLTAIGDERKENIFDYAGVHGIIIDDPAYNLYVNTGVTIGRLQNAAFLLPGKELIPKVKVTPPEQTKDTPSLMIKKGSDDRGPSMFAFRRALVEKGQTLAVPIKLK